MIPKFYRIVIKCHQCNEQKRAKWLHKTNIRNIYVCVYITSMNINILTYPIYTKILLIKENITG